MSDHPTYRSLHIAFVITNLGGGGAERTVLQTADRLIRFGHRVDIVLLRPGVRYHQEIPAATRLVLSESASNALDAEEESRIPASICRWQVEKTAKGLLRDAVRVLQALNWHLLLFPSADTFKDVLLIADYVKKETPDCILPSLPKAKVPTLLAKSLLGLFPVVIPVVHNVLENRRPRHRGRFRILMAHSDHIVAVSDGVRHSVASKTGVPKERITTIYNPVVTPRLEALSREVPAHPGWPEAGHPSSFPQAGSRGSRTSRP